MCFFRPLATVILLSLCLTSPLLQAADVPNSSQVQHSLDSLSERKLAAAELASVQKNLEQTLLFLSQLADSQARLSKLKTQLNDAPRLTAEATRELARLSSSKPLNAAERYANAPVEQLEKLLNDQVTQRTDWQTALSDANGLVGTGFSRPERAQADISNNQLRLQQINSLLKSAKEPGGKSLSPEYRDQLNAEQAALNAQNQLRRSELAGNNVLQELGSSQRELLTERIARREQEDRDLQALINEKRRAQSVKTVADLSVEVEKAGSDNVLATESAANLKLSDYLLRSTDRLNQLTAQNLQTSQQLDSLHQNSDALEEQINVLKGSLLLAKILYQQKQALPQIKLERNLADEIADIRLYQFELAQQREKVNNPEVYANQLLANQPAEQVTPEIRKALLELLSTRTDLLDRLNRDLNAVLNQSITLQLNQKQLQDAAKKLRDTLDEQMFWIPSNKALDLTWLKLLPSRFEKQLEAVPWGSAVKQLWAGLVNRPLFFLPLLLLIGVLLWKRSYLYQKLDDLHQDIGHFKRDSQLHTPLALLLNLLLALPIALFLTICGLVLQADGRGQNSNLGAALLQMAQTWMVFYTAYRVLSPGGVAELHFRWPRPQVAFMQSQVRSIGLIVMALAAVSTMAEHQPETLSTDVIGILIVLACFLSLAWLLSRMLLHSNVREQTSPLRQLVGYGLIALPLTLSMAIALGYFYTALKLSDRLIETLFVLVIWMVVEASFVRGLAVAARRLAYQRAQAKREAVNKEGSDEALEEPTLHIDQVNEQSLRLIRLALFGLLIVGLYWVWADLLSVFTYLDNVTLYEFSSGSGDTLATVPISLGDALGALIIITISSALARNLPGLLEVLVLSRLNLAQGSSYATTTLLSYAIAAVGFVATLSTLGVSWDKLQWLVAALSVGLGFGLQEIFANFISGLIILFERPVRIGDTVTIGTLSGTVSRIQIRATTITDFDRKEIIVPNKTFVTDQLINWSLTDTVTRVVLTIGLAYETDLALARKLIMQAVDGNLRVLREPPPQLFFMNIGASTFNFDLRFHVRDLGDRLPATDELLTEIAMSFRQHKVEMAFNQMDIFVKNMHGQETQLASSQPAIGRAAKPAEPGAEQDES